MTDPNRPADEAPPSGSGAGTPRGGTPKSFGNVSEHHWSRARAGTNREAIEYYRSRSRAPGVAEGGEARNYYCMECDGVIPHDHAGGSCPHCAASLEGVARRYFNWVEIDQPPRSDAGPLLRALLIAGALVLALGLALAALLRFL